MTKRRLTTYDTNSPLYLSKGYLGMAWFFAIFAISFTGMPIVAVVSILQTQKLTIDLAIFLSIFFIIGLSFWGVIIYLIISCFKIQLILTDTEIIVRNRGTFACFYYREVENYQLQNDNFRVNGKNRSCAFGKVIFEVHGEHFKALAKNLMTVQKILVQKNVTKEKEEYFEDDEEDEVGHYYKTHKIEQPVTDAQFRCNHCGGIKPANYNGKKCYYCGKKM